jgi:hypothetical protein
MRPLAILLTLAACTAGQSAVDGPTVPAPVLVEPTSSAVEAGRDAIHVPLSLYVVADESKSGLGTQRTTADVEAIVGKIAPIWAQADVVFDPVRVVEIEMPEDVLAEIALTGLTDTFFEQAGQTFDIPELGAINGFYVRDAAGVNGFTPIGSRLFFVVDEPSVNDERVSSHEIGHILGLHHQLADPGRLMYSGTNGELLTDDEQFVARYSAQGMVDGTR